MTAIKHEHKKDEHHQHRSAWFQFIKVRDSYLVNF